MDNKRRIRVGTRPSRLALKQVEEVIKLLNSDNYDFDIKKYDTSGDIDKNTPISEIEGTDFFTDSIEKALLDNEIDMAIHSAKDLPDIIPDGLIISAITASIDPYDALISKKNLKLEELPHGAKIGTSSNRRKEQLKKYRQDFQIIDIRGNIEERLKKLEESDLDAIVIASAGLIRLGLEQRITQRIPFEILQPHPLQGSLAIEVRQDDREIIDLLSPIDTRKKILFICKENPYISQIAEEIVNHFYWDRFFALSNRTELSEEMNQLVLAIKLISENEIDISVDRNKSPIAINNINFYELTGFFCKIKYEIENKIKKGGIK